MRLYFRTSQTVHRSELNKERDNQTNNYTHREMARRKKKESLQSIFAANLYLEIEVKC